MSDLCESMFDNGFKERWRELFSSSDVGSYFEILFENRAWGAPVPMIAR